MRRDHAVTLSLGLVLLGVLPAFDRLFVDTAWRPRYLAAGLLALGLATALRQLEVGPLVTLATSLVGLVLFTYVTALPPAGLLPDASSWTAFSELLGEAGIAIRQEIAPVATSAPLVLVIATGTWLVVHLAVEVAVRWRRPGIGLLPLLVLWSVPLAIPVEAEPGGSGFLRALPFLAACGLTLLVGTDHGDRDDRARLTTSGLSVGSAALAVAAVAPLLVPGFGAAAWVDLGGADDPRGYQPIVDVTERLRLPEERDVLRIRASERSYLRLAGLDSFDGATWRLGPSGQGSYQPAESSLWRVSGLLPPESEARSTTNVSVEVEVLDLANIYVPTPYQPLTVTGELTRDMVWSTEGGFLATWNLDEDGTVAGRPRVGVSEGVSYRVDAARPSPSLEELRDVTYDEATLARWTQLPRSYDRLAEVADAVYADAEAETAADKALALQDWFTTGNRFRYDLDVPPLRGDEALEAFVIEDRVGYCEYYATAMAVMLRATGIPARVAVGFLPGTVTEPADPDAEDALTEYTVTTSDAHAWVEVLFPGYGWVTFEPTPRSDQTQIVPTAEDLAPVENLRERRARELAERDLDADPSTPDVPDPVVPPTGQEPTVPSDSAEVAGDDAVRRGPWVLLAVGLVAIATATVVAGRRRTAHGTSPVARVLAAQQRLLGAARRYGIGRAEHETTREVVARWRDEGRVTVGGDRFVELAQAAAFGGEVDEVVAAEAERLVADLEAELRASVGARDRAVAPLRVPLATVGGGARRVGSTLGSRVRRR